MSREAAKIELSPDEADELNRWIKEIHVILDNLNTRKPKNDRWLKSHPNVHLHFTPTHTSWLNQVECWFSILSRQALQGASFVDVKQLREAIDHFICAYNDNRHPLN